MVQIKNPIYLQATEKIQIQTLEASCIWRKTWGLWYVFFCWNQASVPV